MNNLDDLRKAVEEYLSEYDNPAPDYMLRRTLREKMRAVLLAGFPRKDSKNGK